jgi:CBS domain-containing protein
MQRKIIPGIIDGSQTLCCVERNATARDAAQQMRERQIGAALVVESGKLLGIVTERDLVFRLLAAGGSPDTPVVDLMTASPDTLGPEDTAVTALDRMRAGRYRHLPVVDGDRLIGMVSIRDLYDAVRSSLQEDLQSAETLIYGDQYGAGSAVSGP